MNNKKDNIWILKIFIISFVISIIMSFLSTEVLSNVNLVGSLIVLIIIMLIGVVFDMIGVSITVAQDKMFHALASRKMKESKVALKLVKNADKAASFANDVIGDICGILSGATSINVAISLHNIFNINLIVITLITTALVSSITIGLKAMSKRYAISKSEEIVLFISKYLTNVI